MSASHWLSPKTDYRHRSVGVRAACVSLLVITAAGALLIFGRVPSWAEKNTSAPPKLDLNRVWTGKLDTGEWPAPSLDPSRLYSLSVSIDASSLRADSRYSIGLEGPGGLVLGKTLHAGDPSFYVTFRPRASGPVTVRRKTENHSPAARQQFPSVRLLLQKLELEPADQNAIEAEPNDSWQTANPLVPGRTIYGGSDDIEYLDNQREYEAGWDWFRIDFDQGVEKLVYFELDLPDRDIPLQLLFYRYNPAINSIEPYTRGKDPMEVLHDGQKVRYSKFISRVLTKDRYYLAVLGNHPAWQLRTTVYPVPPFKDAKPAVEIAMHYMANIGDAWFAQIPRLGSRHRRSVMLHDEAARCTACHPTVFPLESNLTAFAKGYPIRAKSQFSYLMERVKNAPTPLYGNPGVTWVRFVGILLQFFGKQGGLLIDYEKHVTGQPTSLLDRFTGFLQAAWDHREELPADENNGVSPLDSKFGFAWRDWRVLDEMARRTGDGSARASADHIESILASAGSLKRIEGTQDRLHRAHALALMNPKRYAGEIEKQMQYFLARQNEDGGWPGNEEKSTSPAARSSDSVEYLTGQTIHTLLIAGADNHQRANLEKGARWLLGRQQEFGGWFQTETIENFVTPMRETRYAIMALASMYPQRDPPRGLGNRDGQPARLPRTGALLETLDDLDNLWQVPEHRRAEFVAYIVPLLQHENPWVRALSSQCLGRIGDHAAVQPLLSKLNDPDKVVWQSAAWAVRQLGNQGHGADALKAALASSTAQTRRGAARVFAYQFYGMDGRVDILQAFVKLLSDPDLLTRHQAVQTLAQWWYRTTDRGIRGAIVQAFIDRLSDPEEHEVQRFNLSQGLYNLLDENLGVPGTGYGRWISYLKPEHQEALRSERRWQEQEILLKPIFNALVRGGPSQRLGVLLGFDGTPFWRGYTTAAFGPGNDRAFDFERKQFDGLGQAFGAVLSRHDQPQEMGYGLRLAAFFDVFRGEEARQLSPLYLESLLHREATVRQAAAEIADRVSLKGFPNGMLAKMLLSASSLAKPANPEARAAAIKMLRSDPSLLEHPMLRDFVRNALDDPALSSLALPLVASATFGDDEAQAALVKAWPASLPDDTQPAASFRELEERNSLLSREVLERTRRDQRAQAPQAFLDCVSLLDKRPGLIEQPAVIQRLAHAATAGNGQIRQVVFELLAKHPQSAGNQILIPLVHTALTDGRAEVRRAALNAASLNSGIWRSPAVYQHLAQLLVDADSQVRKAALELVARERLIVQEPRLAGRVKALELAERDSWLRQKAGDALRNAGLEPAEVAPTADLTKPAVPDFESFRRNINSYFYQESVKDRRACANCHATHRIFRLAEPPASGAQLGESSLEMNYRSLLRVIDVYEPESSLVLRKPLSPSGQGDEDASSPTGLTHVGGTRWMGRNDPAYQAILLWVRAATATSRTSNSR